MATPHIALALQVPYKTTGSGAANAHGQDAQRSDHHTVVETTDSFDRNLHEDNRAGQHGGAQERREYTAFDIKEFHAALPGFTNDELKRIPILAHGERLEQGGIYLDLHDLSQGEFTAQGGMESQDPHRYVPKADCDYLLWNRLRGVHH